MNRIRELREAQGLSQQALADRAGISQAEGSRLESGKRELTESWMRTLAKDLSGRPADLLVSVVTEFEDEVEPYFPNAADNLVGPLRKRGLACFKVMTDALSLAGIPPGSIHLVDTSVDGIAARKT